MTRAMAAGSVRAAMLTSLFLVYCSPPPSSHDGESDAADSMEIDVQGDSSSDPIWDPAFDEPDMDDGVDTATDPGGDDAATDPYPELAGYIDLVPIPPAHAPTDCGTGCRQVTFAEYSPYSEFDVWGRYLTYNTMYAPGSTILKDIYYVDLDTLETFLVNETNNDDQYAPSNGYVTLWDNRLVFSYQFRVPEPHWWLIQLTISSNRLDVLWDFGMSVDYGFINLQMQGDLLAWVDNRTEITGYGNFYYYDISTETESLMSTEPCFVCGSHGVDLWDNHIVFHGDDGGDDWIHLFVHYVDTTVTEQITTGNWDHIKPSIWENIIVWTDMRNGGSAGTQTYADVYMYDLATGEESVVCDDPASQPSMAAIWGSRIAWRDLRNDPDHPNDQTAATVIDIYTLDRTTGIETLVDLPQGRKGTIKLYEDKLYFTMKDAAGFDNIFEKILE